MKIFLIFPFIYFLATIMALIKNKSLRKKGFDGLPWIECFYPRKHFSFVVGTIVAWIPMHIFEQYVLRFYAKDCIHCIKAKVCVGVDEMGNTINSCGCSPKARAGSPTETCDGNYGPIIFNKKKYEEHRKEFPVRITLNYLN